jgi:hypothetical protein
VLFRWPERPSGERLPRSVRPRGPSASSVRPSRPSNSSAASRRVGPARNAAGLAVQLRLLASTLEGELASIAKDQGILADSLAGVVRESMETLSKAEQGSRTDTAPGGVGGPESAPHRL